MSAQVESVQAAKSPAFYQLNSTDNVLVALREVPEGGEVNGVVAKQRIPSGHKMATRKIEKGTPVFKYGQTIGLAAVDIEAGQHVHDHNCKVDQKTLDFPSEIAVEHPELPALPKWAENRTFMGYKREDGRVGTRNYILIVSSVNCSATVSHLIADEIKPKLKEFPNIDGVVAITHKSGCGIAYGTPQHVQLARTLAGYVNHPNVSRCLVVGLGCEVGQIGYFDEKKLISIDGISKPKVEKPRRVEAYNMQEVGGTRAAIDMGVQIIEKWLPEVNALKREEVSISNIVLALNCGGSDGYSGITANPVVGDITDILAAAKATSVLAETPETYGAHHLLMRRSVTKEVGQKLLDKINWWKDYTEKFGTTMDGNPSHGNKAGGISTIVEKSLGASTKGGLTMLNAVYDYAEQIEPGKGFTFMDTPGHDPDSVTGLIAGGANVVVFTTGRGSCFGSKPAPTIKVATNSTMFNRMEPDMDVNAGKILDGVPREEVTRELFEMILAVASGTKKSKSEALGVGDHEIAPWNIGPTF